MQHKNIRLNEVVACELFDEMPKWSFRLVMSLCIYLLFCYLILDCCFAICWCRGLIAVSMSNEVGAVKSVEGYKPPPEFEEDDREFLTDISLSDSVELWLIQWPANQVRSYKLI